MADGKGCICMARSYGECGCDADWTPQEVVDLREIVIDAATALSMAIPYVAPLAQKNSRKGDEAMATLSHMVRAIEAAKKMPGIAWAKTNDSDNQS